MEREEQENLRKFEKVIEEKKKIPKDVKDKINTRIFENLISAVLLLIYFTAIRLGMTNIATENYIIDLKVFSILLLALSIFIFEYAYKKDQDKMWLLGIEIMAVAIFTLYLIYMYSIFYATYSEIVAFASIILLGYYVIKILIINKRMKKAYIKSLRDIGEIVKK